jgi:GNAT superfamily N-acetyltransferase
MERRKDGYVISTDPGRLDRGVIWEYLRDAYWASGLTRDAIDRSIDNALTFGLFAATGEQLGFARVVTDHARFAWISDVFVLDAHRGNGLGVWLVETVLSHPDLAGARVMLATKDAHGLYERFGFAPADPERVMDRRVRD